MPSSNGFAAHYRISIPEAGGGRTQTALAAEVLHFRIGCDVSPDLSKSMTKESLSAARDGINLVFGVLPGLANAATTGPMVREAQRHLAQWMLQPIAAAMAEECTVKLGGTVKLDVMRPLQAFDSGGRAGTVTALVKALAEVKAAGVEP